MSSHETIGLLLVNEGLITRPQLYDALRLQRQNNRLLGTCLLHLGYIQAENLLNILSRQLSIPALPVGSLEHASMEAVQRMPGELALQMKIMPYSWDGQTLGVAITAGNSLGNLKEIVSVTNTQIGVYVALEHEVEAALIKFYNPIISESSKLSQNQIGKRDTTHTRPRTITISPDEEIPTIDFVQRLDLEESPIARPGVIPIVLEKPKPKSQPGAQQILHRLSLYEAVANLYEADNLPEISCIVGRALLNYFQRLLILTIQPPYLKLLALAGLHAPSLPWQIPLINVPTINEHLTNHQMVYGLAPRDKRSQEIYESWKIAPGATSFIAPLFDHATNQIIFYADNGRIAELYDDLHDIEMLFKEAETAIKLREQATE